jgi:protein tyrosine phosphatase
VKTNNCAIIYVYLVCSDGGGRSGVYLAIDANMELAEEEDAFHVFGYLKKLRQSRKGLIENVVSNIIKLNDDKMKSIHYSKLHRK